MIEINIIIQAIKNKIIKENEIIKIVKIILIIKIIKFLKIIKLLNLLNIIGIGPNPHLYNI